MNMTNESRKTSRQLQAEETREKLLQVSLDLIREKGYDNVKIEEICRMSGASVGSFYHHFKNKAGIVVAVYSAVDRHFLEEVIPSIRDRDSMEAVLQYVDAQILASLELGVDIGLQIYKAQLTEGTEFFISSERALPDGLNRLLRHLQEIGALSSRKSAEEIGSEILVITRGILYNWCLCRGGYDSRALAREMVSNYLQAYRCN